MLLFVFLSVLAPVIDAPRSVQEAQRADSLFAAANYIEAYALYTDLPAELITPRILLRMAYTQEGMGNHAQALHHLLRYHARTYDERAWMHALKLANQADLSGYTRKDADYMTLWLLRHQSHGTLLLMGLLMGCAVWCWRRPKVPFPLLCLLMGVGLFWVWQHFPNWLPQSAVVLHAHTSLMQGPSPATSIKKETLIPGTRVRILEQSPVWILVEYDNAIGYVKRPKLGIVQY